MFRVVTTLKVASRRPSFQLPANGSLRGTMLRSRLLKPGMASRNWPRFHLAGILRKAMAMDVERDASAEVSTNGGSILVSFWRNI